MAGNRVVSIKRTCLGTALCLVLLPLQRRYDKQVNSLEKVRNSFVHLPLQHISHLHRVSMMVTLTVVTIESQVSIATVEGEKI